MANLYLVDKPFGRNGLNLASLDKGAKVVLIQDGVYLDTASLRQAGVEVYAIQQDLVKRGLSDSVPSQVQVIDYGQLVDLIVENKVINFA
jgi:sulfur relay protein TusB/DsrH